jgi:hypothetical protein
VRMNVAKISQGLELRVLLGGPCACGPDAGECDEIRFVEIRGSEVVVELQVVDLLRLVEVEDGATLGLEPVQVLCHCRQAARGLPRRHDGRQSRRNALHASPEFGDEPGDRLVGDDFLRAKFHLQRAGSPNGRLVLQVTLARPGIERSQGVEAGEVALDVGDLTPAKWTLRVKTVE